MPLVVDGGPPAWVFVVGAATFSLVDVESEAVTKKCIRALLMY